MSHGILDDLLRSIGLSATEIVGFKELITDAVFHRREQWEKKTAGDQEAWVLEMAELVHDEGLRRVYLGMRKSWTWNKYLASAAEVRECLPPVPDVVKPQRTHDPNCRDCCGSGFMYLPADQWGNRRVTACSCHSRPHISHQAADDPEVAAWIRQKVAELDTMMRMPAVRKPYQPKATAPAAAPAPVIPFTTEQIQQRKPMERAECQRVEEHLEAQINGRYERQA
jgi:hypothetical protein